MSREILFRAKRIDNGHGEWVEGNLIYTSESDDDFKYIIIPQSCNGMYTKMPDLGLEKWYKVDPSTVCQYTGLTDKSGVKIWENDICTIDGEDGLFLVEWNEDTARFVLDGDGITIDFDNAYGSDCEICGNTFDNPELLEGGTGEDVS